MAGTVGIAKSSVSRRFIRASRDALEALMGRRFDELDILAVWIDGIAVDNHHILAAVGVDAEGSKHLLGLAQGSSENAQVAKDLLSSLVERGIGPDRVRLFVIDGSKALRAAIEGFFRRPGKGAALPHPQDAKRHRALAQADRRAGESRDACGQQACREGRDRETQAAGRLAQDRVRRCRGEPARGAGRDLHRQIRLKLTPSLMRCLASTNVIENPNGAVRRVTHRVSRYRDAEMALRWTATGFLEAEKSFRKIQGHRQLWVLGTALGRSVEEVDVKTRAA